MKKYYYENKLADINSFKGLKFLLIEALEDLDDKDFAYKILLKAQEKAEFAFEYVAIANILAESFEDLEQANELCKKAINIAEDCDDYISLAEFSSRFLNDPNFAARLYEEASYKASGVYDHKKLKESIETYGCDNEEKLLEYINEYLSINDEDDDY